MVKRDALRLIRVLRWMFRWPASRLGNWLVAISWQGIRIVIHRQLSLPSVVVAGRSFGVRAKSVSLRVGRGFSEMCASRRSVEARVSGAGGQTVYRLAGSDGLGDIVSPLGNVES